MKKVILLQRAMVVNRKFSVATIRRQAGLGKNFVYNKIKTYAEQEFIKRAGLGKNGEKLWRLTQAGKRQFDPNAPKEPVIQTLANGQKDLGNKRPRDRAEYRLWVAITELKKFDINDLLELNLANQTTTKQYIALLCRAGILTKSIPKENKRGKHEGRPFNQYSLIKNPGEIAPLMGRCFYLFDPNSGEYWATPMEGQEKDILAKKSHVMKRPGDGRTS
jgi:hypothetical protein